MRCISRLVPIILAPLAACASPGGPPSSFQPRAAETIDPRVPVSGAVNDRPASAALVARLEALIALAQQGDADFAPAVARAEQLAAGAGAVESESWKVAQEALSAAVAARGPTARALGDVDALGSAALQGQGGMSPADLAALQAGAARIAALDLRQLRQLAAIQRRLGM